jgi:hypothetical protein
MFSRLIEAARPEPAFPSPLFLDFKDVEAATASFLREAVLAFRDFVRGQRSKWYPVVANANQSICEDILEVLRDRGGAIMTCALEGNVASSWSLLGNLEPKQRLTYELVCEKGETDAAELMRDQRDTERLQHTTGWNNRLASLVLQGLIIELSDGRSKRFRPLSSTL